MHTAYEEEIAMRCEVCELLWSERVAVSDDGLRSLEDESWACPLCGTVGEPDRG